MCKFQYFATMGELLLHHREEYVPFAYLCPVSFLQREFYKTIIVSDTKNIILCTHACTIYVYLCMCIYYINPYVNNSVLTCAHFVKIFYE